MKYTFDEKSIKKIKTVIRDKPNTVIITHVNPDADAIGSSIGLSLILKKCGLNPQILSPNYVPAHLTWMIGANAIIDYESDPNFAQKCIENAELIFCLDFNHPNRVESAKALLLSNKRALTVLIDHHISAIKFCDIVFSFPTASSTAELVYYLIEKMRLKKYLDAEIASCLYSGIISDSECFRSPSVNASVHLLISNLFKRGIDHNLIQQNIFNNYKINTLSILAHIWGKNTVYIKEHNVIIFYISQMEIDALNCNRDDIDEVVNYGLKLKDVKLSIFIFENMKMVRCSIRSKGDVSASAIAKTYFNGGGHLNSAGGISPMDLEETVFFITSLSPNLCKI